MTPVLVSVVLDNSVLIHYLIRPSAAIRYIIEKLWFDDYIEVICSPELLFELEDVLKRHNLQRYIHQEDSDALLEVIRAKAVFIPELGPIPAYTRDPKDDKFIACAIAGNASFLITLDKDLLILNKLEDLQIITPYDFVQKVYS